MGWLLKKHRRSGYRGKRDRERDERRNGEGRVWEKERGVSGRGIERRGWGRERDEKCPRFPWYLLDSETKLNGRTLCRKKCSGNDWFFERRKLHLKYFISYFFSTSATSELGKNKFLFLLTVLPLKYQHRFLCSWRTRLGHRPVHAVLGLLLQGTLTLPPKQQEWEMYLYKASCADIPAAKPKGVQKQERPPSKLQGPVRRATPPTMCWGGLKPSSHLQMKHLEEFLSMHGLSLQDSVRATTRMVYR